MSDMDRSQGVLRAGRAVKVAQALVMIACGLLLVVVGLLVWDAVNEQAPEVAAVVGVDLDGDPVALEEPLTDEAIEAMDVFVADNAPRLVIEDLGVDVSVGEVSTFEGAVTPPDFVSAFRIRDYGVPVTDAVEGAVFLVTHSVAGGTAPGNLLFGSDGHPIVSGGMTLTVALPEADDLTYTVTGVYDIAKEHLATDGVWNAGSGELVLITCIQNTDGSASSENLIVTARLDGAVLS